MDSVGTKTGSAGSQSSGQIISEQVSCILGDYCTVIRVPERIAERDLLCT